MIADILTTRTDLAAVEVVYRMGSRWRQENQFRYARIHLHLDHDSYATTPDDGARLVPRTPDMGWQFVRGQWGLIA